MNLAEGLAREIARVTELRCHYEEIGLRHQQVMVQPAVTMMNMALEHAFVASGSGDVVAMIRSHAELKGFEK